jgi:hypothetical protein
MKASNVMVRIRWAEPSMAIAKCPACTFESNVALATHTQAQVDSAKRRAVERVLAHHRRRHPEK